MRTKDLELYIHIPFCVRKCHYCDFLSFPMDNSDMASYCRQLIKEIESWDIISQGYRITSIFIGGGTPSVLEGLWIERILEAVFSTFSCIDNLECSIEVNPGTVDENKLKVYKRAGINRISFGLQSTNSEELNILGRIHTYEDFLESFNLARKIGFENINIDLMSAIPTQTLQSYETTLERICALNPEHISAYSLIIEEGTDFYGNKAVLSQLPSEDEDVEMYTLTNDILGKFDYHRYELSNYTKKGYECRHNIGYWRRIPYLGVGLGASSLFEEKRFSNDVDFSQYLDNSQWQNKFKKAYTLTRKEQMEEFVFLGLRMIEGITKEGFVQKFGNQIEEIYEQPLKESIEEGLMEETKEGYRLTSKGYFLSNHVFVKFI
ncbi:MAG: radical SAM family heme chaperone HemW [Anaerostipes sp.]|nr:radical SAM family heme chaperone HemW [Anaerostipes sp.]